MGKFVEVKLKAVQASLAILDEMLADDPISLEMRRNLERRAAEDKARRDAEYAAKRSGQKEDK